MLTNRENWAQNSVPFIFSLDSGGFFGSGAHDGKEWAAAGNHAPLPIGEWTHVTMSHAADGADRVIYVNGREVHRQPFGKLAITQSDIVLGFEGGGSFPGGERFPFEGLLDDLRIYSSGLTEEQIRQAMDGGR